MRRILSLPGLAALSWLASLGLIVLMAAMLAFRAWHPSFLPSTIAVGLVGVAGLALLVGGSWRIAAGPDRLRALAWLMVGATPLWFLAGYFLYGLMVGSVRRVPVTMPLKMLATLGESLMDLEARFRYPMRTAGRKVVMISEPMPEEEARALVGAMDRHIDALEARLGRPTVGIVHWARGPLLGIGGHAVIGLCMGSRPGELPTDGEGLAGMDRHEVAHCVLTSHCTPWFRPPAVLTEGWAQANQGDDPVEQAVQVRDADQRGDGLSIRQLVGPDWYDLHEWPVYQHGAPLTDFLIRRFGADEFIELYATCKPSTFEEDCRRVLGLDLDGLDAAFRADVDRIAGRDGPIRRLRLERLPLAPGVDPPSWKAFVAEYLDAAGRLLAPYREARTVAAWEQTLTDADGRARRDRYEERVLRSGPFAGLRRTRDGREEAFLAHPRRSIAAHRDGPGRPWQVQDLSSRSPEQARRFVLGRIEAFGPSPRWNMVPILEVADSLAFHAPREPYRVLGLERYSDGGRPRVRVRIEDRNYEPPRVRTLIMAADDLFAVQSDRFEYPAEERSPIIESRLEYERHDGVPVLRSIRTDDRAPGGAHTASELKVVDRRFGPIPEAEFDPDRFLDGPRVIEEEPRRDEPTLLQRACWMPFLIAALNLAWGIPILIGTRYVPAPGPRRRRDVRPGSP